MAVVHGYLVDYHWGILMETEALHARVEQYCGLLDDAMAEGGYFGHGVVKELSVLLRDLDAEHTRLREENERLKAKQKGCTCYPWDGIHAVDCPARAALDLRQQLSASHSCSQTAPMQHVGPGPNRGYLLGSTEQVRHDSGLPEYLKHGHGLYAHTHCTEDIQALEAQLASLQAQLQAAEAIIENKRNC